LEGALFFAFAAAGGAMRVPSPAAGTMTNTFIIEGVQYKSVAGQVSNGEPGFRFQALGFRVLICSLLVVRRKLPEAGSLEPET
jgi:hypothetical protein